MRNETKSLVRAFLQGMTGAGLFRKLDYPGAPKEFVDSRSLEEIEKSGEFDQTCRNFNMAISIMQREDVRRRARAEQYPEDRAPALHRH